MLFVFYMSLDLFERVHRWCLFLFCWSEHEVIKLSSCLSEAGHNLCHSCHPSGLCATLPGYVFSITPVQYVKQKHVSPPVKTSRKLVIFWRTPIMLYRSSNSSVSGRFFFFFTTKVLIQLISSYSGKHNHQQLHTQCCYHSQQQSHIVCRQIDYQRSGANIQEFFLNAPKHWFLWPLLILR